jgi:hypothetical protein
VKNLILFTKKVQLESSFAQDIASGRLTPQNDGMREKGCLLLMRNFDFSALPAVSRMLKTLNYLMFHVEH